MLVRDKIRNYQPDDLQSVVDVISAMDRAVGDDPRLTPAIMQMYLETPGVNPSTDNFIVERDGRVIGYADCQFSELGKCFADGAVHPDFWKQGVGRELVRATEAHISAWAAEKLSPDAPLAVYRRIKDHDAGGNRLFLENGYQQIRASYQMRIELDQPVTPAPLPQGLVLDSFDFERDAQAVYEANQETFEDHWGHERASYEQWAHYMIDSPASDVSMWVLARDQASGEIAGICLNRTYEEPDLHMGWTGSLGVRRPWRKQGLGIALLTQSFALFQSRGLVRAGLFVDASSLTNAVALYERAGMHIHARYLLYQKYLRGQAPGNPA